MNAKKTRTRNARTLRRAFAQAGIKVSLPDSIRAVRRFAALDFDFRDKFFAAHKAVFIDHPCALHAVCSTDAIIAGPKGFVVLDWGTGALLDSGTGPTPAPRPVKPADVFWPPAPGPGPGAPPKPAIGPDEFICQGCWVAPVAAPGGICGFCEGAQAM